MSDPADFDLSRAVRRRRMQARGGIVLAAIVFAGVSVSVASASAPPDPTGPTADEGRAALAPEARVSSRRPHVDAQPVEVTNVAGGGRDKVTVPAEGNERQMFLIQLRDAAVPSYTGDLPGLARTAPRGGRKLNAESAPARAYRGHLVAEQVGFERRMEGVVDRPVRVPFRYQYAVNGIAAMLTADEARAVAEDPAVVSIVPDQERKLLTDAGPRWSGAEALWNAAAELGLPSDVKGEGIVIGTIDTGISPGNRSFADVGDDGYDHVNPLGSGNYLGVCNQANPAAAGGFDPAFPCNDKLIGAYVFGGANPNGNTALDYDGHGSHTASTSGGNVLDDVAVGSSPANFDISGVAPHANVISYLGCCTVSGLTAAIDQAIADEVDVINYSIGSDVPSQPWEDFDSLGFLNARAAGIFVAAANGNDGPAPGTTGSPADVPWLTSVGASTHNRRGGSALTGLDSSEGARADIEGRSITGPLSTPTPIVHASSVGDPLCQQRSGHEAAFTGRIVVCDRGVNGRVEKSTNVAAQGAVGFVLINDEAQGDSLLADQYAVPGVFISFADGSALKAWLGVGSEHVATIAGTTFTVDDAFGDVMAGFSSRGPNRAIDTIVPSLTAPGVDIFAALGTKSYTTDVHGFLSGTSMASPHVAGAGALLAQARPNWSPAQAQSALMTTARPTVLNHDGQSATPYAQGSGHIDVGAAARAGLLFDETFADYTAADPAAGGDPQTLNLPSFADSDCLLRCSWQRTAIVPVNAASPVPDAVTWTATATSDDGLTVDVGLTPATVSPGDSMSIDVTAELTSRAFGETLFGRITLTPSNPEVPAVTMPVAVAPASGELPDAVDVTTRRNAGSHLVPGIRSIEVSQFSGSVNGLVPATLVEDSLAQDPTRNLVYDNLSQLDVHLIEVPAGATRLVVETIEAQMRDLDLYVGTGATPSLATEVCASTTASGGEHCDLDDPTPGTWWVAVQNWFGSTPIASDDYVLATGVVPGTDSGNAGVVGPSGTVPGGEPYDVRFHWDLPAMEPGEIWYGVAELGSSPATPGDVGSIPVTLRRGEDDVAKTASVAAANAGDSISYEITVQPNVTTEDRSYTIVDTVPAGLTIDPASVTGGGVVNGQTITWEIETPTPFGAAGTYVASTPATDQQCADWTGFVDLGAAPFNIPFAPLDGDSIAASAFGSIGPFELYGQQFPNLTVTEDGLVTVAGGHGGEKPYVPQAIPDADAPNGGFAPLWSDLRLSLANARGMRLGNVPALRAAVIQWDDPFEFSGGSLGPSVGKFQAWIYATADDTRPEVTFEYDTIGALPAEATIGIESFRGDQATALVAAGDPPSVLGAGGSICLDYEGPSFRPITLGYDVTVDADTRSGTYTNRAVHVTDDPFAQSSTASAAITITGATPPSAPLAPQAAPRNRSVRLTWQPPSFRGTTAITDYLVQRATSRTGPWRTVTDGVSTARAVTVTGLANGTRYFFRVAASNTAGRGPFSAVASATPRTVPTAPRSLAAAPRAGAVRLTWAPPLSNGGAAITDYVIQRASTRTGPWRTVRDGVSTARFLRVTGLVEGTRPFFRVAARNAAGRGPFSAVARTTGPVQAG